MPPLFLYILCRKLRPIRSAAKPPIPIPTRSWVASISRAPTFDLLLGKMRGRRKRLKTGNDSPGISSAGGQQYVPDMQLGSSFPVDSSMFECGSFASRCSVKLIHKVVSKFDSCKKELVKSTGFDGILHFPAMKQIDRKFSLWLMSSVNVHLTTINIEQHICIRFDKYDVGHIFGIPSSGKTVLDAIAASRDAQDRVIQRYLGQEFKAHRSIKIVQEILERNYANPMSKKDADRFRVAFVVFVVSNLLCPSAKYDYASVDYWNAIQDPDDISSYDWSAFVITRLLVAVTKLKQDIANNIKFPNIAGCLIFLQVLYLDSIDLEGLSMAHNTFPRVRDFSFDTIRSMMKADKNYVRHCKVDVDLPIGKLRDVSGCIYSWALQMSEQHVDSRSGCLLATWESTVAMVRLLNIPQEAAGPLFVAATVVAATDIQEQINSGLSVTGTQAIKFMTVLVSLMPYTRGYQSSYSSSGANNGNELLESAINNGTRLLSSFPIRNRGKNHSTTVNSHCLNEGMRAKIKSPNDFDLNVCTPGEMFSPSPLSVSPGAECDVVLSPWELGYSWSLCDVNAELLFEKLSIMQDDKSLAIVHWEPKYIQVSFRSMYSQFIGKREMELDLFDALVRIARQEDDLLFASYGSLRWRHFFESDFMGVILSGLLDLVDSKLCDHLSLSYSSYDLSKCKLVFFPSLLQCQWVCFAWQPEKNLIAVFDSSYGVTPEGRVQLIERACYMLKLALKTLTESVFTGVSHDVTSADLCIMNIADKAMARNNRSGVLCSLFYRCFHGHDLTPIFSKVDVEVVAAKLLYEIGNLKRNSGTFHSFFEELM